MAANLPEKFKVDNFLATSTICSPHANANQASIINDNPLDENFQSDSIIGDNYPPVEPDGANDGIQNVTEQSEQVPACRTPFEDSKVIESTEK